ncbi:MAG: filamentous hemagglutinin N-terminal domain-containing protein [Verrucomicrobiota bacterium]
MKVSGQVIHRPIEASVPRVLSGSIAAGLAIVCFQSSLFALPVGGQLVAGKGGIDTAGKNMTVTAGDRSIFNFTKFNIAADESVKFVQPSSTSTTLARATDGTPSEIFGSLSSNGRVVLANAAGIYFRSGASISVGGLVAAAGNISDEKFLNAPSSYNFQVDLTGAVENAGKIESTGGVALLGRTVVNSGSIVAPNGTVTLMADESVLVSELGSDIAVERNYKIVLDDPIEVASNDGVVKAIAKTAVKPAAKAAPSEKLGVDHSGSITARNAFLGAGDIYAVGVRHTGKTKVTSTAVVRAATKVEVSGTIDASSSEQVAATVEPKSDVRDGIVAVESKVEVVDASGTTLTLTSGVSSIRPLVESGAISISGETVEIKSGATLSARGNLQGGGVAISGADVTLEPNVLLDVSGTGKGHAGSISIDGWNSLNVDGRLVARGGDDAGNGGNISFSSSNLITSAPSLESDVAAPNGEKGSVEKWDPSRVVTIDPGVIERPPVVVDDSGLVVFDKDDSGITPIYYTLGGGVLRGNVSEQNSGVLSLETSISGTVASLNFRGVLTLDRGTFELERPRSGFVTGAPVFQMAKATALAGFTGAELIFASRSDSLAAGDAFSGSVFGLTSGVTGESTSGQSSTGE